MATIKGFKGGLYAGKGGKPKVLEPTESNIQSQIFGFLNLYGIYSDRLNSGMVNVVSKYTKKDGTVREYSKWVRLCKKGTPDLYFIFNGRIHFCETKTAEGRLSPDQIDRHKELRRAGAVVWVARSLESFARQFYEQYPLLQKIQL